MTQHDIAEAEAHLSELPEKAMLGEDVVIPRDDQLLVRLVRVEPGAATRVSGSAKGKIVALTPDFEDPLTDFRAYT
jgi:antitoxin (DNA-binding transcriptional repressor) of toxin-antitoxin stability system